MTQLNTPYPATAYLTGCLRRHAPAVGVVQGDFSLELFLRLFSRGAMQAIFDELSAPRTQAPLTRGPRGHAGFDRALSFPRRRLCDAGRAGAAFSAGQRSEPGPAASSGAAFCPRDRALRPCPAPAPEGDDPDALHWAFGELGVTDRARHLASLFIDDLAGRHPRGYRPAL